MTASTSWEYDAPLGGRGALTRPEPSSLADVLERVLDKGLVIAGDIRVDLMEIELLTIRLRLLIASVDRARELGIDWWEHDPLFAPARARRRELEGDPGEADRGRRAELDPAAATPETSKTSETSQAAAASEADDAR